MDDKNSTEFLADLADQVALNLQRKHGVTADRATDIGVSVAEAMRLLWGGLSIYICKTDAAAMCHRHNEIYDDWRQGGMTVDLVRRHGLTEQRIRQIVAQKRRERRQKAVAVALPLTG